MAKFRFVFKPHIAGAKKKEEIVEIDLLGLSPQYAILEEYIEWVNNYADAYWEEVDE